MNQNGVLGDNKKKEGHDEEVKEKKYIVESWKRSFYHFSIH